MTDAGTDAFLPETKFEPAKVNLDLNTYVSWVRFGLSSAITVPPAQGELRGHIDVTVELTPGVGDKATVAKSLWMQGPGDVLGVSPQQIIRREPPAGSVSGNATTLAHIEFDKPELPWLYSPEPPNGEQLRPWLALVVCETALCTLTPAKGEAPAVLTVPVSELQPLDDSWAWAHAQVHGGVGMKGAKPTVADRVTDAHGAQNLSRLICPRRLEDNKSYVACLVPTYDAGAKAGLGLGGGTLGPAWDVAAGGSVTLPVYDSWTFATAVTTDFEFLARKLKATPAPPGVGRRAVDTALPGGGLPPATEGTVQIVESALHSPSPLGEPANWSDAQSNQLRKAVSQEDKQDPDLPRIGPRLYARHQRGRTAAPPVSLAEQNWFAGLNLRPIHRIAAGLGTRVVQRDQEPLVQAAWAQVGEVDKANRELARLQFGRFIAEAMIARTFGKLDLGPLTQTVRPVLGKIGLTDGLTAAGHIKRSATPLTATSAGFRRILAANGRLSRIARRIDPAMIKGVPPFAGVLTQAGALKDMRRVYREPDGIAGFSPEALATLPIGKMAQAMKMEGPQAQQTLSMRLSGFTPVASLLSAPRDQWRPRQGQVNLAALSAQHRIARSRALDIDTATLSPGRREALGGQLLALSAHASPELKTRIDHRVVQLHQSLPSAQQARKAASLMGRLSASLGRWTGAVVALWDSVFRRNNPRPVANKALAGAQTRFQPMTAGWKAPTTSGLIDTAVLADAFSKVFDGANLSKIPPTPDLKPATLTREALLAPLSPARTARLTAHARLGKFPPWLSELWFEDGRIDPIMAAPRFDRAMYETLEDYDRDWLIANLGEIKQTDFVTLLVANAPFIEAFMVGLSDEMGRELLWRGYPTDQRGTYFHRFWTPTRDDLASPIHAFPPTPLGSHLTGGQSGRIVMMVKGELIKRYPNALFMAVQGKGKAPNVLFSDPPPPGQTGSVSFLVRLIDDTLLVGLDLTVEQVVAGPSPGVDWWFLIAEHPGAPRFGLDLAPAGAGPPKSPNDLSWADLPTTGGGRFLHAEAGPTVNGGSGPITWGASAAVTARMLLQSPARAAYDALALITGAGNG